MAAHASRHAPTARRRSDRLRLEPLESRLSPAVFTALTPLTFTGLNNNGCVAVGDFNKDGRDDAVLTNFGTDYASGAGTTISVLYANAGGGFSRINLNTSGQNIAFAAVGDINGDTWPDVVTCNANRQNTGSVSVFKNDGAGNLSLFATPFSTFSNNPGWVGLHDMTGDGVFDVVVGSFGADSGGGTGVVGNNVTIFQGNVDGQGQGDFTYSSSPITTLAPEIQFIPTALAVADFDGDGLKDIAAAVPGVPPEFGVPQIEGVVYVFEGTGSGGFGAPNQYGSGGSLPVNIQTADLNGDGKKDLIVANAGDPQASPEFSDDAVGVIMNVSGGNPSFGVTNSLTANTYGPFAVAVADFDQNGKADIAAINYGAQLSSNPAAFVSVYLGTGTGTFNPASPAEYNTGTNSGGGQYLAVGNFDANGTPDVIVAHASNKVGVLLNSTTPAVTTTTAVISSQNPSVSGQAVTFTATVTPASGTVPGGTVTFFDGATPIGSPVALVGQQAQVTTSSLSVATHSITAVYSGTAGYTGSTSPALSQVVNTAGPAPQVTINQGSGQADPTNGSSIVFDVQFDTAVTGFDGTDIAFTGSTVGGTPAAAVTGSGQTYTVTVTGMSGAGTVVASVKAGGAQSGTGVGNAASTSTDNMVMFDSNPPTVTINQAAGQAEPTNVPSIRFDVKFNEPVTGFASSDVSLAGSTAGGTLAVNVTGSLDTYTVTVTGITSGGTVVASIPAGGAIDVVGQANLASTSTDNSVLFRDTGTIGFTQAVYTAAAATDGDAVGTVTVTVSRTGPADGPVSISFGTSDGTAHSGGLVATGQADYTPITGALPLRTLFWEGGEGGDKTFEIEILPDSWNEGKEFVNLALTNAEGGAALGLTEATVAIAPSDGQGPGVYLDEDGDRVRLRLLGRTGSMQFFRSDPDGNGLGPIELIELTGTLPVPLRPKASLVIGVVKSATSGDGGTVSVGAITGPGLKSIVARKANLNLEGINLTGWVGGITVGNILNGADITTLAAPLPPNPLTPPKTTRINALTITDGTSINVGAPLASLVAKSFGTGSVTAPRIGTMNVKGDLSADVTLTGVGVDPLKKALGTLRVKGAVTGSDVLVSGNVGTVVVGAFRDSRLFAGYSGPDDGSGAFNFPAIVNSFRAIGPADGFQDSRVIATVIKSGWVVNLNATNGGEKFGFYANTSVGTLKVVGPTLYRYDPSLGNQPGVGDFEVKVV